MVTIGLVVFKKKVKNVILLTDDTRRTTHDDAYGRRSMAIGQLSVVLP